MENYKLGYNRELYAELIAAKKVAFGNDYCAITSKLDNLRKVNTLLREGDDVTMLVGTDKYPYRVMKASNSGKTAWISMLKHDDQPYTETRQKVYDEVVDPTDLTQIRLTKYGWKEVGTTNAIYPFSAIAYRDPSF